MQPLIQPTNHELAPADQQGPDAMRGVLDVVAPELQMDRTACVLAALAILLIGQAAAVDIIYGFWNVKQFGRYRLHVLLVVIATSSFARRLKSATSQG